MRQEPERRGLTHSRVHPRLSLSIGHVAGIDLRVHITWFLLVPLFALAASVEGGPGPWSGLLWLVLIFACIVAHEMAHSLLARRRGGIVHEIILLPIGGVSKLENLPESPADEFAIAIVGPLASIGIGAVSALLAFALGESLLPVRMLGGPILVGLTWFNVLVGLFNMLPAFPLDGGRVLRALLERRYDLETATRRAARLGRSLAVALGVLGVLFNIWLILIAIFIYFGASAEEVATIVHLRLVGHQVHEVMLLDPIVLQADQTVGTVRDLLRHTAQPIFPVENRDGFAGIVATPTLVHASDHVLVGSITTPEPAVDATAPLEDVGLAALRSSPLRAVAVTTNNRVVGLLLPDQVDHLVNKAAPAPN